jgi:hypothetical protein
VAKKAKKATSDGGSGFQLFDDPAVSEVADDEELPKDEVGRQKIKSQYYDLLGIRMQKLRGRILNRERINKTLEGIYFICVRCEKVCHNLDEGLVEDEGNEQNTCLPCSQLPAAPAKVPDPPMPRPTARARARKKARAAAPAAKVAKASKAAKVAKVSKAAKAAKASRATKAAKASTAAKATKSAKATKATKAKKKVAKKAPAATKKATRKK